MFEIDLGGMVDPKTGELLFPELEGKHTPLWHLTSTKGEDTCLEGEVVMAEKCAHRMRVEEMATRVANGLPAMRGDDKDLVDLLMGGDPVEGFANPKWDETPQDEWERFWGGQSPTEKGYVPRSAFCPH
jgi:hypothetical protein